MLLTEQQVSELIFQLQPGDMASPHNIKVLSVLSVRQREEFARRAHKMVLYFGGEVEAVMRCEELAALAAAPEGYSLEALNGLNIGCGGRLISSYLTPVDIMRSPPTESIAGTHHDLCQGAFLALPNDLPFKDNSIDFIVALHMLEHVGDPVRTVKGWLDIVKPGGGIGVVVPDWRYTWDAREDRAPLGHKWNPTPDLIRRLYADHWSNYAVLQQLDTYDFKISFDFVLRKHGSFTPFKLPEPEQLDTGHALKTRGVFLHGN